MSTRSSFLKKIRAEVSPQSSIWRDALDVIRLNSDYEIVEIMTPMWLDSTPAKLDIRKKYGITILEINRDSEFIVNPSPDSIMKTR